MAIVRFWARKLCQTLTEPQRCLFLARLFIYSTKATGYRVSRIYLRPAALYYFSLIIFPPCAVQLLIDLKAYWKCTASNYIVPLILEFSLHFESRCIKIRMRNLTSFIRLFIDFRCTLVNLTFKGQCAKWFFLISFENYDGRFGVSHKSMAQSELCCSLR